VKINLLHAHGSPTNYLYMYKNCRCLVCRGGNRDRKKAWRNEHPERLREYGRHWARENREKVRAKVKRWEQANKEKVAANARRKRARRDATPGSHTDADVRAQYERQKGRCFGVGCSRPLGDEYHIDHFVPIHPRPGDPAGTDDASNIVLMCPGCNLSKSNLHPMDYSGQLF
jgi:hypothetical protein